MFLFLLCPSLSLSLSSLLLTLTSCSCEFFQVYILKFSLIMHGEEHFCLRMICHIFIQAETQLWVCVCVSVYKQLSYTHHRHTHARRTNIHTHFVQHTHTHKHTRRADSHNDDTYLILFFSESPSHHLRIFRIYCYSIVPKSIRIEISIQSRWKRGQFYIYKCTNKLHKPKQRKTKKK